MIPFAILSCQIHRNGKENQEVRILDLSGEGFTFRLVQNLPEKNAEGMCFLLHFFRFGESQYREMILRDYSLEVKEEQEFYTVYRVTTENKEYQQHAKMLMKEYLRYISLKLECDDAELSKELVGYPAELEEIYAENFAVQKEQWFSETVSEHFAENFTELCTSPFEFAISVDNPVSYETYLKLPMREFVRDYWERNKLAGHSLAQKSVDCLYIGNQFCHLLLPKEDMLFSILEKMNREQVKPVVVFTYMQESQIAFYEQLLKKLAEWCAGQQKKLELVINDWGMLSMIREKKYECFTLTLGVLLQKHRKDVRMRYKQGFQKDKNLFGESAVRASFYREYLREHFGITRISYEACGYPVKIAPGKASLHLPFYQMNTSQHCTLYARCHNGDRGKQTPVKTCPGYCRDQVFLYPESLHMIGRYNSLFGYDETILTDGQILQRYLEEGVDRVVMELL